MNVTDIKVGDLVFINHLSHRLTPCYGKVLAILNETDVKTTDGIVDVSILEPIRINPFLRLNGFTRLLGLKDKTYWRCEGTTPITTYSITLQHKGSDEEHYYADIYTEGVCIDGLPCDSIHILQHALNLVGIEKEITLI